MVRRFPVVVCLLSILTAVPIAAAAAPAFTIRVFIECFDAAAKQPLRAAERETAQRFGSLGIHIEWRDGAARRDDGGVPAFSVIVLSKAMAARKIGAEGIPDATVATANEQARRAYVFYDRLSREADRHAMPHSTLLARVLTHELGHLIAALDHAPLGIMRSTVDHAEAGFFGFTDEQKQALRQALTAAIARR